jgi:hypothetical protein
VGAPPYEFGEHPIGDGLLIRVGVIAMALALVVTLVAVVLTVLLGTTPKTISFSLSRRRALLRSIARSNLKVARDFVNLHTLLIAQLGGVERPVLPMEGDR